MWTTNIPKVMICEGEGILFHCSFFALGLFGLRWLFELISARYERRSIMITANQPFGEWNKVFPDPAMTLAAVDRLVHHVTIFEMNVESYRRRTAMEEKRQRGRSASFATIRKRRRTCQRQST